MFLSRALTSRVRDPALMTPPATVEDLAPELQDIVDAIARSRPAWIEPTAHLDKVPLPALRPSAQKLVQLRQVVFRGPVRSSLSPLFWARTGPAGLANFSNRRETGTGPRSRSSRPVNAIVKCSSCTLEFIYTCGNNMELRHCGARGRVGVRDAAHRVQCSITQRRARRSTTHEDMAQGAQTR